MNKKVLIGPSSFAAVDTAPLDRLIAAGFDVVPNPFGRKLKKEELLELLPGVSGLIAGLETLDREVMALSDLEVISRCGSGMSNVDREAAKQLGITVFSTPEGPVESVAELTVGMIISLIRMVPVMDNDFHQNSWNKKIGLEVRGKTILIIGFGKIGKRVAELLKPFKVNIIVSDPLIKKMPAGMKVLPLDRAIPQADLISLHASGEVQILGEAEFKLMKERVYLLNGARGGLVDEECLKVHLEKGKVAGAWLDSFREEPYTGPLTNFSQVILTPHVGSYTTECRSCMESDAVSNLMDAFANKIGQE